MTWFTALPPLNYPELVNFCSPDSDLVIPRSRQTILSWVGEFPLLTHYPDSESVMYCPHHIILTLNQWFLVLATLSWHWASDVLFSSYYPDNEPAFPALRILSWHRASGFQFSPHYPGSKPMIFSSHPIILALSPLFPSLTTFMLTTGERFPVSVHYPDTEPVISCLYYFILTMIMWLSCSDHIFLILSQQEPVLTPLSRQMMFLPVSIW